MDMNDSTSQVATAQADQLAATGTALDLIGVNKIYQTDRIETIALSDINVSIAAGEFVSIMGPSGSGKSTLLNILGLLDAPSEGQVMIGDRDVAKLGERECARLRNRTIGFIFQTFQLIADLDVLDNVQLPLLYRKISPRQRREMAEIALDRVGLDSRRHHFPGQLSGGQQQRVAVARAIVGTPDILLADEPTGNLDSRMGDEIMDLLEEYNREAGITVVMVTHDQRLAERTQRILRLFDGRQVH